MNKENLDYTVSVYQIGIQEGLRRGAAMLRENIVRHNRTDLYEIVEYFAKLLEGT